MVPAARLRRALTEAGKQGADALLVTDGPGLRYLCGFTGSNGALLLRRKGKPVFYTDGRYTAQASQEVENAKVVILEQGSVAAAACVAAVEVGVSRCGFDDTVLTVAGLADLQKALPAKVRRGFFVAAGAVVARLREIKDELELDRMRDAAQMGVRLFEQVLEHIVPGNTEAEVALALEYMARLEGAERMSFETIVAGGKRSALPHGRATTAKLPRRGFVVLDFGVVLDGYCSDMTRTVYLGKPRPEERRAYEAVLDAQESGVATVRAGVEAAQVDAAARNVLAKAGLAEWFTHSTGHGVGLEIHEGPRLGKTSRQALKAGMVVTIEPGVYLPDRFGIRIEDTVVVGAKGCEILTTATRALIEL